MRITPPQGPPPLPPQGLLLVASSATLISPTSSTVPVTRTRISLWKTTGQRNWAPGKQGCWEQGRAGAEGLSSRRHAASPSALTRPYLSRGGWPFQALIVTVDRRLLGMRIS